MPGQQTRDDALRLVGIDNIIIGIQFITKDLFIGRCIQIAIADGHAGPGKTPETHDLIRLPVSIGILQPVNTLPILQLGELYKNSAVGRDCDMTRLAKILHYRHRRKNPAGSFNWASAGVRLTEDFPPLPSPPPAHAMRPARHKPARTKKIFRPGFFNCLFNICRME